MIPEFDRHVQCKRRLDFDTIDAMQVQALGKLQPREVEMTERKPKADDLQNLFDEGNFPEAMKIVCQMIKDFEKRIEELERNHT